MRFLFRDSFNKICMKTSLFMPRLSSNIYFCTDLGPMKFKLQFTVKIEPHSVLACFTHWILPHLIVKTGLNGLHRLYTIKFNYICHPLLGKSGLKLFWLGFLYVRQVFNKICQSEDHIYIIICFNVIYVFQIAAVVFFKNAFGPT